VSEAGEGARADALSQRGLTLPSEYVLVVIRIGRHVPGIWRWKE
jgi:hypothetical protein